MDVAPGVNIQLQTIRAADVPDLRRFGAALLILDWESHVAETLALLEAARLPIGVLRWTQDPMGWASWPRGYVQRCGRAVFGNEPDVEGSVPEWYRVACGAWRSAGGLVVEPAWSDEASYQADGYDYDIVSVHVYPAGLGAANLAAVRARAAGRPVLVTEAGVAGEQATILPRLAALGVTEPVYLYSYRARDAQAMPAYDLAGVALLPPATPASLDPAPMIPASVPPAVPVARPAAGNSAAATGGSRMAPTTVNDYCSELGPDGSGHARCGLACMVSVEMSFGNAYDPYQRLLQLQAKAPWVDPNGMTSDQLIALAESLGYQAAKWVAWTEATAALDAGKRVLCLLDNWYLRPRMYPIGANWDALHWLRLTDVLAAGKYAQVMDSLVYVPGEYPRPYQGPSIVETASIQAAIAATTYSDGTPISEAGILIWK